MNRKLTILVCFLIFASSSHVYGEEKSYLHYDSKTANEIISANVFRLTAHDMLQVWEIEFDKTIGRETNNLKSTWSPWHVVGTLWWADLLYRNQEAKKITLNELDPEWVYSFTGYPIEQNYSSVTFYVQSPPIKLRKRGSANNSNSAPLPLKK